MHNIDHNSIPMLIRLADRKILTEEQLNSEFRKSSFKSHQAFLVWKSKGHCLESRFWEWMESCVTKYNKDGSVYRK